MRRAAKVDGNHAAVVKYLEKCGMTVQSLAAVGNGVPDLLVGWRGVNVLIEVKDGDKVPSKQGLTVEQVKWHGKWMGQVSVATDGKSAAEEVIRLEELWRQK